MVGSSSSKIKPMPTYTIKMIRTYETIIEVDADTQEKAIAEASSHPDRYAFELEQCCVTSEEYVVDAPPMSWSVITNEGVVVANGFTTKEGAEKFQKTAFQGYYSDCAVKYITERYKGV